TPAGLTGPLRLMDYGLHRVPAKLTSEVQQALNEIEQPSLVVLGYGLCGNGLRGIRAGAHTLLVPRTDDCIAILLGSYRFYMRQFNSEPGTYWLTKGWLESGSHPLKEYAEYTEKYGAEEAMWLLDQQYQHYKRIALVAPNPEEMAAYRAQAQEVARFCERWGMRYEEVLGSDDYVGRLIELAAGLQNGTIQPDAVGPDFLVIPPGGVIKQDMFMR
ncbi:MAG TPA: DUF1638 domain-containing protein, partial [Anaerolineae bacterium]